MLALVESSYVLYQIIDGLLDEFQVLLSLLIDSQSDQVVLRESQIKKCNTPFSTL